MYGIADANKDVLEHVQALDWEDVDQQSPKVQDLFVELNKAAVDGGYEGVGDPRSESSI